MTPQLFGRAWNIQVLAPSTSANQATLLQVSSSDKETRSLRVTFEIEEQYSAMFSADLKIYNPNFQTIQAIPEGSIVSISAGYQNEGTPTEIFRGAVFQARWGKEEPYTTVLELQCYLGLPQLMESMVSVTVGPLATQRETVLKMAEACSLPVAYVAPDEHFNPVALPRHQTIFGTPQKLFAQIASNNNAVFILGPAGVYLGPLTGKSTPDIIYAPPIPEGSTQQPDATVSYRLIGTPTQVPGGVEFTVLLDPRLTFKVPPCIVQLKNSVINQYGYTFNPDGGGVQVPSILTQDGVYAVIGVRHVGDTRGNTWETRVIAAAVVGNLVALTSGGVH